MKPAADLVPQPATPTPVRLREARPQAPVVKPLLWFMPLLLALCLQMLATAAHAQDDPPGRVGRLANLQGPVSWFDHEEGQWVDADRNRPLTTGDRVATGGDGRAELRVGSSVLRLAAYTELEVLRLDDDRMVWQLHSGSVAVRLRSREAAQETELVTGEIQLQPERAGHYRIDRVDDTTWAAAWRGSLRGALPGDPVLVETGQRLELWRESARWPGPNAGAGAVVASSGPLRQRADRLAVDEFAAWALAEDGQDDRSTAYRYVSPEMTGAEDLDRHGRWEQHPEYGALWFPTVAVAGWAPYRFGRWAWVQPWGWTWVDDARWGFAPFHYGRWVNWRGRWAWSPGTYVARPVFAPALVAWVGGPRLGVSVSIGRPPVAWVPLAPREVFMPPYRHSPVYGDRVNVHVAPPGPPPRHGQVPTWRQPVQQSGPMVYTNQGVPGAVTVVPRDVLLQRQPVARAVVDVQPGGPRSDGRFAGGGAWEAVAPPAAERRQRPDAGRDDNVELSRPVPGRPEPRDPRGGIAPVANPGPVTEPTVPARGPAVQPPVVAPVVPPAGLGGVPALPPQRQPPQPPQQTTPPLAPAVPTPAAPAGPNLPAGPRFQVPATEPQLPQAGPRPVAPGSDGRPPRDQRSYDRRSDDMPRWSDGPQRPAGPGTGSMPAGSSGPASPPSARLPAAPMERPAPPAAPAPQPAVAPPAAQPAKPPAAQPAPAPARTEKPRENARSDRPAATDRADKPDAEEGRKRAPDNRNRPREQLN